MNSDASHSRSPAIGTNFDAAWVAQRLGEAPAKTRQYVGLYLAMLQQQGRRPDTLEHRGYTLLRFLRWLPANLQGDLTQVSEADVGRFLEQQRAQGRQANTLATYLATLRGFFRFLTAEGVIVHWPCSLPQPPGRAGRRRATPAVPQTNAADSCSVDGVAARLGQASAATQEWVRCYLAMLKRRGRKADTVEQHRCAVTRFIAGLPLSHQADLSLVLPADVSRFVDELQAQGRHPNTILTYLSPLNGFFEFLFEEGVVRRSPVQRRHYPQRPDSLPRAIGEDEVNRWLRVLTEPLEQAIFVLLLRSGVRIGEVVTLNRADVDVERCTLYIRTGNKNGLGRVTYFSRDAQDALRRWLVARPACPGEEALFIHRRRRVGPGWIRERFKDSLRRAGLPLTYRVHDLRHTYATLLLNAGLPITTRLPKEYPILLEGGAWGIAEIHYEPNAEVDGRKIPFFIANLAPFQVARIDVDDYKEARALFTSDEWIAVLMSTIGLNPAAYSRQESLYVLARFLPLVEPNLDLIELGPRGTGKTYGIRNISPYSFVIIGGKTTAAQLFLDLRSRSVGVIAKKDVVVFDEIAYARFDATRDDVLGILKDYLRRDDHTAELRARLRFSAEGGALTTRDEEALLRLLNGFVKLLYPDGRLTDEELRELGDLACELRTRIIEQQHFMELVQGGRTVEFPRKRLQAQA